MEKINYPLLHFDLQEEALLGILVGAGYQAVDKDLRSLRAAMLDHLQRQYKKHDEYPYQAMLSPRLKIIEVNIRPAYRDDTGSFPLSYRLRVPVPVIYGETSQGHYECHLPLLESSFYYYEARQFDALVDHFIISLLNQMEPSEILRLMAYPRPGLDILTLRVKSDRHYNWSGFRYERSYETLSRLAERYPYPKQMRRSISAAPDAAWELEHKVAEVLDKLIITRSNVLIVGNHGVGKSAVLSQVIRKVTSEQRRQNLDYTFWRIMPQRITASAKYLGEWEETVEELVEELSSANGILWVVDIVQLLQSGGEGPEDSVAAFLLSFLQQGKLQLIGEATPQELDSMRRLLPGFVESFQVVTLEELPEQKIQTIFERFAEYAERALRIRIDGESLALSYRLLLRYYPYESFPGKGINFLGQCVSEARLNQVDRVDKQAVVSNFIRQTGLPELFLRDELLLDQEELHHFFQSQIIGQPAAVRQLSGLVKIYKAGLNNPYRPISTLLFAGPTGVGKTASAKVLASYFFGKGQQKSPLIRIDMSEFQHPGQLGRLIGAGNEVGQLVKEVRERPFAVVLLDEVEKADPTIFDALLTVLDEGMLVDNFGRVANFRNTIIIMTSNLGASNRQSIGYQQTSSDEAQYLSAIEKHFRPEFVNRIDGIVLFRSLSQDDIRKITYKELDELRRREGFVKRRLTLEFTDRLVDQLTQVGFDERYGARPLQRALEHTLVNPMAQWLLDHPEVEGEGLWVDFDGGVVVRRGGGG